MPQLLADYRRSREQLASVHQALQSITESASSPDGLITASVDSAGTLSGLKIADDAYRSYRPAELADAVLRATRSAAVRAGERARRPWRRSCRDADPAAVLSGTADLTPEEIRPPAPARTRPDDDETYEETTWMNRTGRGR